MHDFVRQRTGALAKSLFEQSAQAIEVVNFKGHQEVQNEFVGDLLAKGYYIGRQVKMTKRISIWMNVEGSNEKKYADMNKGQSGFVQGMLNGMPVVAFNVTFKGGEERSATAAIKDQHLSFDVSAASSSSDIAAAKVASGGGGGDKSLPKGFEFLEAADGENITVHKKWIAHSATTALETKLRNLHSRLGLALACLIENVPKYTEADLHVVVRNNKTEVWTARDFPAHGIVLAPETTEWKDRLWCQGSSVLVKYGTMCLHVLTVHLF